MKEKTIRSKAASGALASAVLVAQLALAGCSSEISGGGDSFPAGSTSSAPSVGAGTLPPEAATAPAAGGTTPGQPGANPLPGEAPGGSSPGTTPGAPGTPATPAGGTPSTAAPAVDEPSAGYIRRLTHIEYDNTVADLLGIDGTPSAAFASDVATQGFTNNSAGQNVTPTLAEQYIESAEQLSAQAVQNLPQLLGCAPAEVGEDACIQQFITDFGQRAWRRPLTAQEQARATELFNRVRPDYELSVSVQLLVQYFLLSPQFGYLVEPLPEGATAGSDVPLDSWKVATRLSYFLLGSMPDDTLLAAAESGELSTPEAVAEQARRLLQLPRARERVALFFTEWLRLRHIDKLQKDTTLFPDYDLSVGPLLLEQVQKFVQSVILDDGGSARDLLTAPYTFANDRLASIYGVEAPPGSNLVRVELDPTQRAGLLTHAAVLASLSHQNQTDPVVRGKFVRESVLCDAVPPPPVGLVVMPPEVTPGSTTRERFRQHQEDPSCAGCHALMDPIGLGFESYDPLGQWRDTDNGLAVDATGEIIGTDVAGTFNGAVELSEKLANSDQVMACFAQTWMRFALGRSQREADVGALNTVGQKFEASGFKMSELLVALTETRAFRHQRVLDPNESALEDESILDTEEETP